MELAGRTEASPNLNNSCTTGMAVALLESQSPASANIAGIGEIFSGPALTQLFNAPGLPPNGDPRTPDILVTPNIGVTYSGSTKKLAEHGGFSHDDTNVMMLLSHPSLDAKTVTSRDRGGTAALAQGSGADRGL